MTPERARTGPPSPTGEQWEIRLGEQWAVAVQAGGGLRAYEVGGRAIVAGYGAGEPCAHARGLPLIPWPNRLRDGVYTFAGRTHSVPVDEPALANAIHGLTKHLAWHEAGRSPSAVTVACLLDRPPGYPFRLYSEIEYRLDSGGLTVTMRFENAGEEPLPLGAGAHPYLCAPGEGADGWSLRVPAGRVLEVDERMIPTGRELEVTGDLDLRWGRPLAGVSLDHAFTGLERDGAGNARVSLRSERGGGAALWMDAAAGYVQVYTGEAIGRAGVAIEPMSCPAGALASGRDLVSLPPGGRWTLTWGIEPIP